MRKTCYLNCQKHFLKEPRLKCSTHQCPEVTVVEAHIEEGLPARDACGSTVTEKQQRGDDLVSALSPQQRHIIRPAVQCHVCRGDKRTHTISFVHKQERNLHLALMLCYLQSLKWRRPGRRAAPLDKTKP